MIINLLHKHYRSRYHGQYAQAKILFALDLVLLFSLLAVLGTIIFLSFWKPAVPEWVGFNISFGTEHLENGGPITINFDYSNRSSHPLKNVLLTLQLPPDFQIKPDPNFTPEFSNHWTLKISEIPPQSAGQKQIHAILWVKPQTSSLVRATMSYVPNNLTERLEENSIFVVAPVASVLQTQLSLATTSSLPQANVAYSYVIKNTGPNNLLINLESIWSNDTTISATPQISLAPNETRTYTGLLKIPSIPQTAKIMIKASVPVNGHLITQAVDAANIKVIWPEKSNSPSVLTPAKQTASAPLSSPTIVAQTRYYTDEGDKLGSGPTPPQLGQTTKYWVFIEFKNLPKLLKDVNFSAILAAGAEFTGKQSVALGTPLTFDAQTKTISWHHTSLGADSHAGLYFEVSVTPTIEQSAGVVSILRDIKFSGIDATTEQQLIITAPDITNHLPPTDRGSN